MPRFIPSYSIIENYNIYASPFLEHVKNYGVTFENPFLDLSPSQLPTMADPAETPSYKYFNLTYPIPYVAHVEINRPEKMNAFIEE